MSTAPNLLSIPTAAATPPTVVGQHYCQGQLPLRDALVRRLRGWAIASHRPSLWPPGPPGGCSAPAEQYSGMPLPLRLGLCPRLGRPAQGRQHRPIGATTFPPDLARPGTFDGRNRQDVPPAGAPAARSMLYLYPGHIPGRNFRRRPWSHTAGLAARPRNRVGDPLGVL